jgi:hypothetical protein
MAVIAASSTSNANVSALRVADDEPERAVDSRGPQLERVQGLAAPGEALDAADHVVAPNQRAQGRAAHAAAVRDEHAMLGQPAAMPAESPARTAARKAARSMDERRCSASRKATETSSARSTGSGAISSIQGSGSHGPM